MSVAAIKPLFAAAASLTCTLASLASSTSYVGRQTALVDNTTSRYGLVRVFFKIKLGTSPAGGNIVFHLFRSPDGSAIDGGAGASDAGFTPPANLPVVFVAPTAGSPSSGDVIQGSFLIHNPGGYWGLSVSQDTTVALDATGGNHSLKFVGENPEAQLP